MLSAKTQKPTQQTHIRAISTAVVDETQTTIIIIENVQTKHVAAAAAAAQFSISSVRFVCQLTNMQCTLRRATRASGEVHLTGKLQVYGDMVGACI